MVWVAVLLLFFAPFPGTPEGQRCAQLPRRTDSLSDYDLLHPVLLLDGRVSNQDLVDLKRETLVSYYGSPEYRDLMRLRRWQMKETFVPRSFERRQAMLVFGVDIWDLAGVEPQEKLEALEAYAVD